MEKTHKEKLIALAAEMKELNEKSSDSLKKFKQTTAQIQSVPSDQIYIVVKDCMSGLYDNINYINERIGRTWDSIYQLQNDLYDHANVGHLPKIQGAGKMNEVLKKVGLSDDAEAKKKIIYASQNGKTDIIVQ